MRRGRIFIYLALIVVIAVAAGAFYFLRHPSPGKPTPVATLATPQVAFVQIVTAGQNIYPGAPITDSMLSSIQIPQDKLVQGEIVDKSTVVNKYAKYMLAQGQPIMDSSITETPGNVYLPGSNWAPFIPQGLTAVAIPVTRLSAVGYGIRDGDYVDVIVTLLLVDIDPTFQSALPNFTSTVIQPGPTDKGVLLTGAVSSTGGGTQAGQTVVDDVLKQPIYQVPSENQRPRMVTQMIMQNLQVLHVGTFPLPSVSTTDQLVAQPATAAATPTPQPAGAPSTGATPVHPDIVTLMVSPQDAVTLTYLIYNGAQITLTLRNPNDQQAIKQPSAANLEYLLTQYNIPIPAKLPYSLEPRVDVLTEPKLPNDIIPVTAK
jgi:Flp pilus assembly protein CpaB